jgi:hypothetical protein
MLHTIARWLISRSIDEKRRVPDWLRHWIDGDAELKRFEMLSRQLEVRLKDDARGWIAGQEQPSEALPTGETSASRQRRVVARPASFRRERSVVWSLAALGTTAVAAGALYAIARLQPQGVQAERRDDAENREIARIPATVTITTADREWLATAWNTGRVNLGQWQARALDLPVRMEISELPDLSAIVQPAESAGSTAGRALATLDRGMLSEQQRLTAGAKSGLSFFAYRLPAGVARLVGWQQFMGGQAVRD